MKYDYWFWYDLRQRVLKRDRICQYCGIKLNRRTVKLDHVIPKAKNGEDTIDNIVASCRLCNEEKADMLPLNFFAQKYGLLPVLTAT